MSFPSELNYKPKVSYPVPAVSFNDKIEYRSEIEKSLTHLTIAVSESVTFDVTVDDIFQNYTLRFNKLNEGRHWWNGCDMKYWQNQLNFAVWCASAGCGVSWEDHLNRPSLALILGMFRFHVYFQTRKILKEMECPLPGDDDFNAKDNHINHSVHQRICREFSTNANTDFRAKIGPISGMGTIHSKEFGRDNTYTDWKIMNWSDLPRHFQYTQQSNNDGWVNFIPRKGKGFSQPGIQRINDSIRAYVYCVLVAQSQTRSPIVGDSSTAFDAQKEFLVLLEDRISQSQRLTLPEMIAKYDDAITQTYRRIDYAIGPNLYMIPSDLVFKMKKEEGYNNNITIATADMKFGVNDVNSVKITSKKLPPLSGISDKVKRTTSNKVKSATKIDIPKIPSPKIPSVSTQHEDNKAMLSLGLGAVIGFGIIYFKR